MINPEAARRGIAVASHAAAAQVVDELRLRGYEVGLLGDFDETMGHAGALVRHADGTLEGAADPRSDGGVAGF